MMSHSSVTPEGLVTEAVMSKGLVPMVTEQLNISNSRYKVSVEVKLKFVH